MGRTLLFILFVGLASTVLPSTGAAAQGVVPAMCGEPGAPPPPSPVAAGRTGSSAVSATAPRHSQPPVLSLVRDLPLPGSASRFDYQSLDPTSGRLYLAHLGAGQLVVVDTRHQRVVGTVAGLPSVTGVLAVPALHRVFAAVPGRHEVAVIDDRSLQVVARLGPIGFPDGLDYAPQTHQVFVSDEGGGGELVIDARTTQIVTTIALSGEAGNTHFDPVSGCVLVAVQNRDQLVALDPTTDRVVGRYALESGCAGPHGFLINAPARVAYVSCEDDAKLLIVNLTTMQVTASAGVGDRPDVLAVDPGLGWLYVASEAGVVSVFAARGETLQPLGAYRAPHAHSVAVDPRTHRVYLPLEQINGRPVLRILAPNPAVA